MGGVPIVVSLRQTDLAGCTISGCKADIPKIEIHQIPQKINLDCRIPTTIRVTPRRTIHGALRNSKVACSYRVSFNGNSGKSLQI